jgi:hypothetical protein
MEWALVIAIFVIGAVTGSLITLAMVADSIDQSLAEVHSIGDDIEKRARRVQ